MKLDLNLSTNENSFSIPGREMTFDAASMVHIKGVLGNLYKNPILACIREYSTNAMDANLMAGHSEPINVTLPTMDNLIFSVQDSGIGLAEEDVYQIFGSYGASTKRDSNQFNGQLGFGSKSAFSYTSNFSLTSRHNGTETYYSVYEDEIGNGRILKLGSRHTNEPNGVVVTIPVKRDDCRKFVKEALDFYTTFQPTPILHTPYSAENIIKEYNQSKVFTSKDGHSVLDSYGESYVLMGNVIYPFPSRDFSVATDFFENKRIELKAEIGECNFTPSRESVRMDEKTRHFIQKALQSLQDEVVTEFVSAYDAADTVADKFKIVGSYVGRIFTYKHTCKDSRGFLIPNSVYMNMEEVFGVNKSKDGCTIRSYYRPHNHHLQSKAANYIDFTNKVFIVVGKVKIPGAGFRRVADQFIQNKDYSKIYYINTTDGDVSPLLSPSDYMTYEDFLSAHGVKSVKREVKEHYAQEFNYSTTKQYGSFRAGRGIFSNKPHTTLTDTCYIEIKDSSFILEDVRLPYTSRYASSETKSLIGLIHVLNEKLGVKLVGVPSSKLLTFKEENPEVPHLLEKMRDLVNSKFTSDQFREMVHYTFHNSNLKEYTKSVYGKLEVDEIQALHNLALENKAMMERCEELDSEYHFTLKFIVKMYYKYFLKFKTLNRREVKLTNDEDVYINELKSKVPLLNFITVYALHKDEDFELVNKAFKGVGN